MLSSSRSNGNGMAYFLCGLFTGGAIAVLMAPLSGREMRGKIREGIQTGQEKIRESAEMVGQRSKEAAHKVMDGADEILKTGKKVLDENSSRIAAAVEAGKSAYNQAQGKG